VVRRETEKFNIQLKRQQQIARDVISGKITHSEAMIALEDALVVECKQRDYLGKVGV